MYQGILKIHGYFKGFWKKFKTYLVYSLKFTNTPQKGRKK
jgi:hypothetical protein